MDNEQDNGNDILELPDLSHLKFSWASWLRLLDQIKKEQEKTRQDFLILFVGAEGSGKSNVMLHTYTYLREQKGLPIVINNVSGTVKGFFKSLYNNPRDCVHVLDEGKELVGINASTKIVKKFNEVLTTIREMGNVYAICFRNPLHLQGYLRDEKVFAVVICWKSGTEERGDKTYHMRVYRRNEFNEISEDMLRRQRPKTIKNILSYKEGMFECRPPLYKSVLLDDYMKLKKDIQVETIKEAYEMFVGDVKEEPVKGEEIDVVEEKKEKPPRKPTGGQPNEIGILIQCDECGYQWRSNSKREHDIQCPHCNAYENNATPYMKRATRISNKRLVRRFGTELFMNLWKDSKLKGLNNTDKNRIEKIFKEVAKKQIKGDSE